ncbi:MAG: transglycosylase SLT domain-containing protein [Deltaproteobacteria bacterium]|nr:transglycosylase SLT domain-containing protein [Deltaproteobacteria bacterium]
MFVAAGCASRAPDAASPFALTTDRDMERHIAAIDAALSDLEVEEADHSYRLAAERLKAMVNDPYKTSLAMAYREQLVQRAGLIVAAKRQVKDLPRVIVYHGYDPNRMESMDNFFSLGDLRQRLLIAPPDRQAEVQTLIDHYAFGTGRRQYQIYLDRLAKYRSHIESVFAAHGLPPELACVAMIESAVDPTRVSHANAAGLWQFIPGTARRYNLAVTATVDQRFDPELQTYAAAAYLHDLLSMFGGAIEPALAGYNAGEGFISSAMISEGVGTFWDLDPHGSANAPGITIPRETYDYVARFFAVAIIYQNLSAYGFEQPPAEDDPFVLVQIEGDVGVDDLAMDLDLAADQIGSLNPSLVVGRTDDAVRTAIKLPAADPEEYVAKLRATRSYRISYIYRHKVTNYQSLRAIAEEYGVSAARIANLNDLTDPARLPEGLVIEIPCSMSNADAALASRQNLDWWEQRFAANERAAAPASVSTEPQASN